MGDVKVCIWHKLFLDPWSHRCSGFWMPYCLRLSWVSRAPPESLLRRLFPWKSLNKIYTSLSLSLWWVGRLPYCSSRVHLAYFPLLVHLWLKDYLCMLFFWSSFSYFKTLLPCSSMFWLCTSGLSGERCLCYHLNGAPLSAAWASLSPMKSQVQIICIQILCPSTANSEQNSHFPLKPHQSGLYFPCSYQHFDSESLPEFPIKLCLLLARVFPPRLFPQTFPNYFCKRVK